jgi:DNA polymerase III epsilon subunit-like protein
LRFLYKNGFDFQDQKRKYYDTLEIAKSKLKRYRDENHDYDVYDYKLETLCDFYGIKIKDAHRSLSDCYATAKLFINLLDEYELREND